MKKLIGVMSVLCVTACTSQKISEGNGEGLRVRVPASEQIQTSPEPTDEHLATISNIDELKSQVATWIRYDIILGAHVQKIVASFDVKMSEALNAADETSSEKAKTELKEISCQSMELLSISHEIDDQLKAMYRAVVSRNNAELNDWFIERFASAGTYDTAAQTLARTNYLRSLKYYHDSYCDNSICRSMNFSKKRLRFPFDVFNNQELFEYRKSRSKEIALFFANPVAKEGSCLSRNPASDPVPGTNYFGLNLAPGLYSVTYDDGPSEKHTLEILNQWTVSGLAKPAFFQLAHAAYKYPQVVKAVSKAGAEIACHTWDHADMTNLYNAQDYDGLSDNNVKLFFPNKSLPTEKFETWKNKMVNKEIFAAVDGLEAILKSKPVSPQTKITKFRFPYGNGFKSPSLLGMLKTRNLVHFHWTVDSLDYDDSNPLSVYERVRNGMKVRGRGVILFHDLYPQTVEATRMLIQHFKAQKTDQVVNLNRAL